MHETPHQSTLHQIHTDAEAYFLPYGSQECHTQVVETYGDLDIEYATLRKGVVVFDEPHKGMIRVSGTDRIEFLNNLVTNQLKDLKSGECTEAFMLDRKGKIIADVMIAQRDDDTLMLMDRHQCSGIATQLDSYVFSEDVEIKDCSNSMHKLSLHGPSAKAWLSRTLNETGGSIESLSKLSVTNTQWIDRELILIEHDLTGEVGLDIWVDIEHTIELYQLLIEPEVNEESYKVKKTGWLAVNAARIEAGHPIYPIDFDDSCVPAESGMMDTRVSVTKGCYLGQEVVARMHARNVCARSIVAIKLDEQRISSTNTEIHQPTSGSQIFEVGKEGETPIGYVTSSTISPMLGAIPICFAMIKSKYTQPGAVLKVSAEGALVECTVQDSLKLWSKP